MNILFILSLLLSNAVTLRRDLSILFNRIAIIALIFCALHDIVSLSFINKSIGLYVCLLDIISIISIFKLFIFVVLVLELTTFCAVILLIPIGLNYMKNSFSMYFNMFRLYIKCKCNLKIIVYSYSNNLDIIFFSILDYIYKYTKNINSIVLFTLSLIFLFFFGYFYKETEESLCSLIYLNLWFSLLLFNIGHIILLARFTKKFLFVESLNKYPRFIRIILKFIIISLLLLNIFLIIFASSHIIILLKGNILNKIKEWKLNLDYEMRKGNKSPNPKKPGFFKYLSSKSKEDKRIAKDLGERAQDLKEKLLEAQKDGIKAKDTEFLSLAQKRSLTKKVEIPEVSDFTIESQLNKVKEEFIGYSNKEKEFKRIVIDIDKNKENFYPNESKPLFNEYISIVRLLKKNLRDIHKELKKKGSK